MPDRKVLIVSPQEAVSNMFKGRLGYEPIFSDIRNKPDLVVFTGGADINPRLYQEEQLPGTFVVPKRDEEDLIAYKRFKGIPKVGICRGAQLLNIMSGGFLWQHVDNHRAPHDIYNLFTEIAPKVIKVSSVHHQMMIPSHEGIVLAITKNPDTTEQLKGISTEYKSSLLKPPPEYEPEVVWYSRTKSLCFQPHPEWMSPPECTDYFFQLLEHFFPLES